MKSRRKLASVNFYDDDARMGLHQDRDEQDLALRLCCRSRSAISASSRRRPQRVKIVRYLSGFPAVTSSFSVERADFVFHGVDRIYPATSTLLKNGGRINLTLRRVNP